MLNKILTKAIVLAPLAAILINPSVAMAKEKTNNISMTGQEVVVAKKVKYEEEKEAFLGEKAVKYKGKWGFIDDVDVNAILKKKELFFSVEAKSKKDAKGNYVYKKWKKSKYNN